MIIFIDNGLVDAKGQTKMRKFMQNSSSIWKQKKKSLFYFLNDYNKIIMRYVLKDALKCCSI